MWRFSLPSVWLALTTAPVDDVLEHIQAQLPALASQAGVEVIVSKWDLVYQAPSTSFVDVTDLLVAAFDPNERGLKSAREIVTQEPLPLGSVRED